MQVVESDTFETIIMGLVMLNIACLAIHHVGMSDALNSALFWLSIAFTVIFTVEVVVKLIGLGTKQYFQDRWCMFDFFVTVLSLVQIAVDIAAKNNVPAFNLLRVFRVARVFRLVPKVCIPYLRLPTVTSY
jgi:Ion transport protein